MGYLPTGVSAQGGVCLRGCLPRRVSAQGSVCLGGVCLGGVSAWGKGVSAWGGLPKEGGVYPSMQWGRHQPVNRIPDRCKNITFSQTSFAGGKNRGLYTKKLDFDNLLSYYKQVCSFH